MQRVDLSNKWLVQRPPSVPAEHRRIGIVECSVRAELGPFVREDADSTQTQAGDVLEARDLVWIYENVMSDERVGGTSTVTINYDMDPTGIADMWGTTVLTNDGGTWEGEWVGSIHSDGTHTTYETLTGTGDYAGLR